VLTDSVNRPDNLVTIAVTAVDRVIKSLSMAEIDTATSHTPGLSVATAPVPSAPATVTNQPDS
jgi:hypothetical protein